jgi:hypothetical protein
MEAVMFQMLGWHADGRPLAYDTSKCNFCLGLSAPPIDLERVIEYAQSDQLTWCSAGHKELAYEWMSGHGPAGRAEFRATMKRLKGKMRDTAIALGDAPHLAESSSTTLSAGMGETMSCPDCHKDYNRSYSHCPYCAASQAGHGKVGSPSGPGSTPRKNMWGFPKSAPKVKEYKRTCSKCGNVWYVPRDAAKEKGPNGMQMTGATLMSISSMGLAGGYRAGLEAQKTRVQVNSRCGNCGSSSYSESKDW